ncbi:MAG: chromatin protein Cren7 [Acidilobus sp.]
MPGKSKASSDPFTCPVCGVRVTDPERTWTIVSPIPDSKGRVTVTVMGAFRCPNGHTWKAVIRKFKSGGEGEGGEGEGRSQPGEVITLDLSDIQDFDEESPPEG